MILRQKIIFFPISAPDCCGVINEFRGVMVFNTTFNNISVKTSDEFDDKNVMCQLNYLKYTD
jgi:hypothetical protein